MGCMVINLSWIYDECKIVTGNHPRLFISPDFLDLSAYSVTLNSASIVTDGYNYNPVNIQLVLANNQF